MESRSKVIDTFQIVGFAVSTGVTIVLVVAQVDPMQSALIGLMLAIMTQLFDLQLRHSSSEERLLQANALSQALYRDPELLSKFRQMVEDYYSIRNGWFDLFKLRAEDVVSECHRVLRSMAGGTMEPPPRSEFTLASTSLKYAKTSLKQVVDWANLKDAVAAIRRWYAKSMTEVAARGVQITNVVVLSREDLKDLLVQKQHTDAMPGALYLAFSDELPAELDESFLIVDDRVVSLNQRRADGTLGERTVSIVPVEVEKMVKRFDQVLRYARRSEEVLAEANNKAASHESPT